MICLLNNTCEHLIADEPDENRRLQVLLMNAIGYAQSRFDNDEKLNWYSYVIKKKGFVDRTTNVIESYNRLLKDGINCECHKNSTVTKLNSRISVAKMGKF